MIEKDFETLTEMKPADKAKAFDLIVNTCKNKEHVDPDVEGILKWCTMWFGD